MQILIIDGTSDIISAFIISSNWEVFEPVVFKQNRREIYKALDSLFSKVNISDIDVIAFNCGPGSFTCTRATLAYLKGLSLGYPNLKFISFSGFDVLESTNKPLRINATRGKVYIKNGDKYEIEVSNDFSNLDYKAFLRVIKHRIENEILDNIEKVGVLYISNL